MRRIRAHVVGATIAALTLSLAVPVAAQSGPDPNDATGSDAGAESEPDRQASPQRYRVLGPDTREQRTRIARTGVAIDEVGDDHVVVTAHRAEIEAIKELGFTVELLPQPFEGQIQQARYRTYSEMVAELESIAASYPHLARKVSIGRSHQGRDIPALKISNNVHVDEDVPEILINGNLHARERLTSEMNLYLAAMLTEQYGRDPAVTRLLDSREIWIVPMANPDGVVYDMVGSGRMWRKNRQPNRNSPYIGTDLNRNWAHRWGCCGGSSNNPRSDVYRGAGPESAPEVRALANFVRSRVVNGEQQITAHIDFHTYSELVLWPMGYTYNSTGPDMSPDENAVFVTLGRAMAQTNGYRPMQSSGLYITDGSIIDWMWANQGIFSFTFEMYPRHANFYPPPSVIERETARNRAAVLHLMEYADCPYRAIGKEAQYCVAQDEEASHQRLELAAR
ncbi:M14 family metallopeptidase [Phytoactinopolyspora limicola]|uniref:M14 family metallopeptidase n=1 Tax=Phytoactinopolyspora limicola TaxID=2715536 RepID=UPI00140B903F|nr:M14 family metallopeptidase [Phytoactinopolyspora limicola]